MSVDIVGENALPGSYTFQEMLPGSGQGDLSVAGFARSVSKNVGETIQFSVNGPATSIRIIRAGWYGGMGFREVATITNTPTTQPAAQTVTGSLGATSCSNWSVTAEWQIPANAVSGMYLAMIRNAADNDAFYATFVVRDDAAQADIIYKTSDTTWGSAYNHFGTIAEPNGKNIYGSGTGVGNIMDRCYAGSYHRPVITRGTVSQTYWWACELPLIRWLERNGFTVKYVSSVDLDQQGVSLLADKTTIFLSSGHDEYWTQNMRDAVETWRDVNFGRSIFMSGNEVFWKARFEYIGDEAIMWCYKDTMPGPTGTGHVAGEPLDPVTWTGTWKDTRWADRRPEWLLTGTSFGMNGVFDYDAIIPQNPYGGLKVWGESSLVDNDITLTQIIGFEADNLHPTQPEQSARVLAAYTRSAPGGLSDPNGEFYNVPGNIEWGIIFQRYAGGGATVGFGTCQWSWVLDGTHDRGVGESAVSLDAQQFTVNLLRDMGAEPATVQSGIVLQPINPLDDYALVPPGPPIDPVGEAFTYTGTRVLPYVLVGGVLTALFDEEA